MKRIFKQLIIITVVIVFISSIVFGIIWIRKERTTCFDGIKNGQEEEVDCGGSCEKSCPPKKPESKALSIKKFQIIEGGGKCDLVAIISNPNTVLGAQHVPYTFKWGGYTKSSQFFIYPSEERYLADINIDCQSSGEPTLEIGEPGSWEFFRGFEKPRLEIPDSKLNPLEGPYEFAEIVGNVFNKSSFDLQEIEIYAALQNNQEDIVAINKTTINAILVGEKREFRMFWTRPLMYNGGKIHFYTTSNLFNSQNFIKKYGVNEKWNKEEEYEF